MTRHTIPLRELPRLLCRFAIACGGVVIYMVRGTVGSAAFVWRAIVNPRKEND